VSQAISLTGRHAKRKRVARTEYLYSIEKARWLQLKLEAKASTLFYNFQMAKAKLISAKIRLNESNILQNIGRRRNRAGDISRFHRDRLNIVREKSHQRVLFLTTQYQDNRRRLIDFLQISSGTQFRQLDVKTGITPPKSSNVTEVIKSHPKFKMMSLKVAKQQQELSLARAKRFADITVRLYQEQDEFNNKEESVSGIGVSIPLPIWNTRRHSVNSAKANLERSRYGERYVQRDLMSDLNSRRRHLKHLITQIEHYRKTILVPAKRIFYMSKKRFRAGDTGMLVLVDTINTYFEAINQYLSLVKAALSESVKYRLAAGILIVRAEFKLKSRL